MSGYLGRQPISSAQFRSVKRIATEGQSLFTNLKYIPNLMDVYVNGGNIHGEFTATDGTSVLLDQGLSAGDVVVFKIWGTFDFSELQSVALVMAGIPYYVSDFPYEQGNLVRGSDDNWYESQISNNVGNDPVAQVASGDYTKWQRYTIGGATGGGTDEIFYGVDKEVTSDVTLSGKNFFTVGPLTITPGTSVTVSPGTRLVIV